MKVAIVQEYVDVRRGGAETSTVEMARALAALGLDVTLVCHGTAATPSVEQNVTFLPIVASGATRALRTYRFVQGVHALCRTERFDVVHAVTPCLCANVYQPRGGTYPETVARTLALTRSPLVRSIKRVGRLFNVRQRFLRRIEAALLRKRQQRVVVAALSDYVRRQVVEGLAFPPERTHVVFNGVALEPLDAGERVRLRARWRAELGLDRATPLLLFVAHNFRLKGLRELLHAVARQPDWSLAVVGRDDPAPYRSLAQRLGLAPRVRFAGAAASLRGWYAAADVLAHPTWYDPCSRVVLEALSVGLPVVTTRHNGAAEVMEPDRHGAVIAEPRDTEGLSAALDHALAPAVRAACAADAPRMAERLSMARHARELQSLYEGCRPRAS